ncbi:MAG: cell wall metabolism sensor histidine kinase WalK [Patescibacteria group bacterium]|nr:cell wall metabolism sensor histidine kinase WalK [Patescibacteria group bacterium]
MEKKTISVHALTVHIYTIAIVALLLLLAVLGIKYVHLKWSVNKYTASTIWMNQQEKATGRISDYAVIIADGASGYISSTELQNYVTTLSKSLNRDIVVLDKARKVLADTIPANKGTIYGFDSNNEIQTTLADGKTRQFEERSADYPNGVWEVAVPMKNAKGDIIGAVLVSNTQVFR